MLGIAKPERDELNRLLNTSNQAAEVFGLPTLYTKNNRRAVEGIRIGPQKGSPKRTHVHQLDSAQAGSGSVPQDRSEAFHISIAWVLDEPNTDSQALLKNADIVGFMDKEVRDMIVEFGVVKVKIGNAISVIRLDAKLDEERGILG